jgi:hypothetical protein
MTLMTTANFTRAAIALLANNPGTTAEAIPAPDWKAITTAAI